LNKRLKTLSCAIVAIFVLSLAPNSPVVGPLGVDAVSAATGEAPAKPSTKPRSTSPTKSYTPAKQYAPTSQYTSSTYSSPSSSTVVLQTGSTGDSVKSLQDSLNSKGYNIKVDGFFGLQTLSALKNYQSKNDLKDDGIAGPATFAKLNAKASLLTLGSSGSDVKLLQTSVNKKGYKLTVDGFFGQSTVNAVKDYQNKNGLKADGVVGPATLSKLNAKVISPAKPITPTKPPLVTPPVTPPVVTPPVVVTPPDTTTSASVVDNITDFQKSISKDGNWIVAILNDVTTDKNLVLDGKFLNGKKDAVTGVALVQRKLALYAQDDKHVVTARYTLTAPKLTILSPEARIQGGTFKGDVYVNSKDFLLTDATIVGDVYVHSTDFKLTTNAKIQGNVYFDNIEAQKTFTTDATSSVTGKQEHKDTAAVDSVASASIVNDETTFENAISAAGTWIIAIQRDMVINNELVLEGTKSNKKVPPAVSRKLALYYHDGDNYTTARFTLTAPKLTIKSPMANITKGIFRGDLYISASNFQLIDARVEGNVYFTTQAAKDTFKMDATSKIIGTQTLKLN